MNTLLEMQGIARSFGGVPALCDASLAVRQGEAHALVGANGAGKSTLMNVLGGLVPRDAGRIVIGGRAVEIASPAAAGAHGIRFVHQELNMLPSMTVAENVLIDDFPTRGGLIARRAARARVVELLARLQCSFGPDDPVEALGMGDRQMVEIARALARDPRIVIFDEPTSSLPDREKRRLFDVVLRLKAAGAAVIYITHFIDEIFDVCDRVTVMRNGSTVGCVPVGATTVGEIVRLMLGDIDRQDRLRITPPPGEPVLSVRGLSRAGAFADVGLTLGAGEIVGLWGLLGSGRTEIMRALVGLDAIDAGEIRLRRAGALVAVTPAALHAEVGFVTEDRRGEGLLLPLSVATNIAYANLDKVTNRLGLIVRRRERQFAEGLVQRLGIRLASVAQPVRTLSGGNQQKVVFARWLGTEPRLFFLDEPTRGLDVGAKTEILRMTVRLAESGAAVLLVSSELEEMMRVCDRYLVVQRGRITGELAGDADKAALLAAVSGPATRGIAA